MADAILFKATRPFVAGENGVPIPAPQGWAERYAVYWGAQEAWACDAQGASCVPWDGPTPRVPVENWGHDPVRQANPPRVIVGR